ncbi:MAG: response regulator [Streptosporangiaceae bacterium]
MRADLPGDEQARRAWRTEDAVKGIDVLLVEDDPGDVLMTKEAFEERHVADRLHVVGDGVLALQFLRRTEEFTGAPRPGLILLDLNLPRCNGLEVLAQLKADGDLRSIPVVVLTSSQSEQDILRSYSLHANAFVTKPLEFEKFLDAVRQIDSFFLALAKLPN